MADGPKQSLVTKDFKRRNAAHHSLSFDPIQEGEDKKKRFRVEGRKKIIKKKVYLKQKVMVKCIKSLKSKRCEGGPEIKRYSTKTRNTHTQLKNRRARPLGVTWSTVPPALFHDGRHTLLVLPLVLLVQLGRLTVSRTVWVWFVKQ